MSVMPNRSDDGATDDSPASARAQLVSQLFRENNRALIRFLTANLVNENDALEVAQEAYVRLLQLDRPDAISYLRTYLFRTALNLAIDRSRRATRAKRHHQTESIDAWLDNDTVVRAALAEQEIDLVRIAIQELKPKYRRALVLHKFHDLSIAQVAADMNITPRMVRSYITRALVYCQLRIDGASADVAYESMMEHDA
jgi:RNA polymerase sigma factor (sigma-70 family)